MPRVPRRDYSTRLAKRLRSTMSDPEVLLWSHLRYLRAKFRRQEPLGRYITDFCCHEGKLVVEVDGSQHGAYDTARDEFIASLGFLAVRVWASDVMADTNGVVSTIAEVVERRIAGDPSR